MYTKILYSIFGHNARKIFARLKKTGKKQGNGKLYEKSFRSTLFQKGGDESRGEKPLVAARRLRNLFQAKRRKGE